MKREINSVVMTGPTGVIGMAVIDACIKKKIRLLLITRKDSVRNADIPKSEYISVMYADASDYDSIDVEKLSIMENVSTADKRSDSSGLLRFDAFIHLAWIGTIGDNRNNMELQTDNIKYTLSAVRLAYRLGCKIFMGAGSQAEYGRAEGYLNAQTKTFPENGYGMAKLCAGQMSRVLCEQLNMEHIWLRVLSIYGPHDGEKTMVMSAIKGFMEGKQTSFTEGGQKWDYLYSKDAAEIMFRLLQNGTNGRTYCIGSGHYRLLKEYIHEIYRAVFDKEASDEQLGIGKVAYAPKQVMFLCADTTALKEDIGELPFTDFADGIRETIEWYRNKK